MKALRLFIVRMLVVLLAVLLPLRGAVGAMLACPGQGQPGAPCVMAGMPGSTGPQTSAPVGVHGAHEAHGGHGSHAGHHAAASGDALSVEPGEHADVGFHSHAPAADPAQAAPSCGEMGAACSFCASGCHAAALVPVLPVLADPDRVEAVDYPVLVAPAPRHFADGPERPPRSL